VTITNGLAAGSPTSEEPWAARACFFRLDPNADAGLVPTFDIEFDIFTVL
jgi:hypothetical protein